MPWSTSVAQDANFSVSNATVKTCEISSGSRVIQLNTLEDRNVTDKAQWDAALKFLETSLQHRLEATEENLRQQVGPNFYERWLQWQSSSEAQKLKSSVRSELERLLSSVEGGHKSHLPYEEVSAVGENCYATISPTTT